MKSTEEAREAGNLYAIKEGDKPRVVAQRYVFGHLGMSRCGRFFCCDDRGHQNRIVIGSVQTGRTAVVCYPENNRTYAHAYITPDLKWVMFNSNRTGSPHIYPASVPERLTESLLED